MSAAAQTLLAAFDALPDADREVVVNELLSRHPVGAGELPDVTLLEMADELFQVYDAEEAGGATSSG